jgi:hypothetical protein
MDPVGTVCSANILDYPFSFSVSSDGVKPQSLHMLARNWPNVPILKNYGESGGTRTGSGNWSTQRKTYPSAPLLATNPAWSDLGHRDGKPGAWMPVYGMVTKMPLLSPYSRQDTTICISTANAWYLWYLYGMTVKAAKASNTRLHLFVRPFQDMN